MTTYLTLPTFLTAALLAFPALAQEDEGGGEPVESSFTINGSLMLQTGVFMPLLSDGFKAHTNKAWVRNADDDLVLDLQGNPTPCDPVMTPQKPCFPADHGQPAGSLSMFRSVLQLESDWTPNEKMAVHVLFRGVRSLELDADGMAQMPRPSTSPSPAQRRAEARAWARDTFYQEFDLRELYLDVYPTDWFSLRLGRQQVTWGETGQFRLLDVINPIDTTWHLGPLESFEDTRVPLLMAKALLEFPAIEHDLELVWMPGLDRPEDMVTPPLTLVGAWGLPYTNTPSPYVINEKIFMYPRNNIQDNMRFGFRWKGAVNPALSYSLVYYYTHQLSPPIPLFYDRVQLPNGLYSDKNLERLYLGFPRQNVLGFTLDFTLENPVGMVIKLEAAVEPDRTFPRTSTTGQTHEDPRNPARVFFGQPRHAAYSYALVLMRPTMIRWLNPTQNVMLVFQFMHTMVPGLSEPDKIDLIEITGFNDYKVKVHAMTFVFSAFTTYLRGLLTPRVTVVWAPADPDAIGRKATDPSRITAGELFTKSSMFITTSLAMRLGEHWRAQLTVTDFFGFGGGYSGLGLFYDRDEINLSVLCQF